MDDCAASTVVKGGTCDLCECASFISHVWLLHTLLYCSYVLLC